MTSSWNNMYYRNPQFIGYDQVIEAEWHICVGEPSFHRILLAACSMPNHYLNQWCRIVNPTFRNKFKWYFFIIKEIKNIPIQQNSYGHLVLVSKCYGTRDSERKHFVLKHKGWYLTAIYTSLSHLLTRNVYNENTYLTGRVLVTEKVHVDSPLMTH